MSILTITMNPAIDQTVKVDKLCVGEVQRAESVHYTAGGKGINVASCLADWNVSQITVSGLMGQANRQIFDELFQAKNIQDRFVRVEGHNRTNIKIVDREDTTDINLPGISSNAAAFAEVLQNLQVDYEIAVLSGSLPTGCDSHAYVEMLAQLQKSSAKVIVDASGEALVKTLEADVKPYCIKPNIVELSDWVGKPLVSVEAAIDEADKLIASGIILVVISMGGDGALFITDQEVIKASLKAPKVLTTVGAGDAMVAGIAAALQENKNLERVARLSTAFAVSKLAYIGPILPEKSVVEAYATEVVIERLRG